VDDPVNLIQIGQCLSPYSCEQKSKDTDPQNLQDRQHPPYRTTTGKKTSFPRTADGAASGHRHGGAARNRIGSPFPAPTPPILDPKNRSIRRPNGGADWAARTFFFCT